MSRCHHYYKLIAGEEAKQVAVALPNPIGGAVAGVGLLGGGPSRTAYINRNGMFITDAREPAKNPFRILKPPYCPDYAVVVVPADAHTQDFIRGLEPPAHDEIQPNSIEDGAQQQKVKGSFAQARRQLREFIAGQIQLRFEEEKLNAYALAAIVGGAADDRGAGEQLNVHTRNPNFQQSSSLVPSEQTTADQSASNPPDNSENSEDDDQEKENKKTKRERRPRSGNTPPPPPSSRASALSGVRLANTGPRESVIMFTTGKPGQTVKLQLAPSGEMDSREAGLQLTAAREDQGAAVTLKGDVVEIQAQQARRYRVRLTTADDISRTAISIRNLA